MTDLPGLSEAELTVAYTEGDKITNEYTDALRAFFYGFQTAKAHYAPEFEELSRLRQENKSLNDEDLRVSLRDMAAQAQQDKNDATKANVLLVQAEKKIAELTDPYSELQQYAEAWNAIIVHPVLKPAFGRGGTLVQGVQARLDELAEMEKTVNELRPVREADTATLAKTVSTIFDEDFRTSEEEQAFTVAYETSRALSLSIMDTAKAAWLYARAIFEPATTEENSKRALGNHQIRQHVIDLMAPKMGTGSLREFVTNAIDWVMEEDSAQRLDDLSLSNGVLQRAKIVNSLRNEDQTSSFTD